MQIGVGCKTKNKPRAWTTAVVEFFSMPRDGEVVNAPFRANRRLMFVMRRFLYIAQSIQMLAFCIISFAVGYILPDWASWMI